MGSIKDAQVTKSFLNAGIHTVVFKGITKSDRFDALELTFDSVEGKGTHVERIWEPRSNERVESQYGPNPSESEQFMCKIKQVISALHPELAKRIETNGEQFEAPDFDGFIKLLKKYLDTKVGTQTQIKLVPTRPGFCGFPAYIANISRDGNLYMNTKIIGEDLVLTPREKKLIDEAVNAKPTVMKDNTDELADLAKDFSGDVNTSDDGLPF